MVVSAWAKFDRDTAIRYVPCRDGDVELVIGGDHGFTLLATDEGLARLAGVISAARGDERWRGPVDDPE
jgi:hypothetical protein